MGQLDQAADHTETVPARLLAAVLDDPPRPVLPDVLLQYRWDGSQWMRWSAVWHGYEAAPAPPPLETFLETAGISPMAGDRFRVVDGMWRPLAPDDPDATIDLR